ncbi:Uncharacterized protein SCF082_LOCUS24236 [Durusdinium trenchii]|uniref:H(+)-exporting diphosphatase n=1 Tax=Durusdinium trenchii TaxID=1381693 RepID=A0ABP0LU68_9DINO
MDASEISRLQEYLRNKFSVPTLSIRGRANKDDSAEVYLGEEFIGVIFRDDEEGDEPTLSEAPAGIVGNFVAKRPVLSISVFSIGLTALAVVGLRQAGGVGAIIASSFMINALVAVALPVAIAAMEPRSKVGRIMFLMLMIVATGLLVAASVGDIKFLSAAPAPPLWLTLTTAGFALYLCALTPMMSGIVRLGVLAPLAAILGVGGAAGHFAVEAMLASPEGAGAVAIALATGASIGAGVSADFSKFFAKGFSRRRAAAAAGHAAVAPIMFTVLAVASLFAVQSINANFGVIEWRIIWPGLTAVMASSIGAMIAVAGALSIEEISEMVAVDENRRRQWFSASWRPFRRLLPVTTSLAVAAIAGVVAVIAVFEAGFAAPVSLIAFFVLIAFAAGISFVSFRTSIMIAGLLGFSALLAGYGYQALGLSLPPLLERLIALTIGAVALGHLTVSWRDAGDQWRNARDVVENALSDGLRRYLFLVGAGAVSLFVSSQTFSWPGGRRGRRVLSGDGLP